MALATRLAHYGAHRARLESGQLPPAYAMVKTAHEARCGARPAAVWLPDPAPVQDPGYFTCVCCGPWRGAFAGSPLWRTRGRNGTVAPADLALYR